MIPKISIIIPAFNYAIYFDRCLHSLFNQSFTDFEILVIDDASTDNTYSIASKISDKRLIYIKHNANLGVAESVAEGQNLAKGDYICQLDADDWLPKDSLLLRYNYLEANHLEAVHTGLTRINDSKKEYIHPLNTNDTKNIVSFLRGNESSYGINSVTFMYKRSIHQKIGFRSTTKQFAPHDDYEYSLRLLTIAKTNFIDISSYNYIIHSDSYSQKNSNSIASMKKLEDLKNKYISIFENRK